MEGQELAEHTGELLAECRGRVGKSTLVVDIATNEHPAQLISLDDEPTANAAREDPAGFVAAITGPTVIDEIQRGTEPAAGDQAAPRQRPITRTVPAHRIREPAAEPPGQKRLPSPLNDILVMA